MADMMEVIDRDSSEAKPKLRKVKGIYKHEVVVTEKGDGLADHRRFLGGGETRFYENRLDADEDSMLHLTRREQQRRFAKDKITEFGEGKAVNIKRLRRDGRIAKETERGEDGISKKVRHYDADGKLKSAYETNKNGERTRTYLKRLGYKMSLSSPNVDGNRTLETSFGKGFARRYSIDLDGSKIQTGRRNLMSSKYTTLGELGDPDVVRVKHLSGLVSKTYESDRSGGLEDGAKKTELARRIGFYRRKFERNVLNESETSTWQLGKTGRLLNVKETRVEGSDKKTVRKEALFGLYTSEKQKSVKPLSKTETVDLEKIEMLSASHSPTGSTLVHGETRQAVASLQTKLDERIRDRSLVR